MTKIPSILLALFLMFLAPVAGRYIPYGNNIQTGKASSQAETHAWTSLYLSRTHMVANECFSLSITVNPDGSGIVGGFMYDADGRLCSIGTPVPLDEGMINALRALDLDKLENEQEQSSEYFALDETSVTLELGYADRTWRRKNIPDEMTDSIRRLLQPVFAQAKEAQPVLSQMVLDHIGVNPDGIEMISFLSSESAGYWLCMLQVHGVLQDAFAIGGDDFESIYEPVCEMAEEYTQNEAQTEDMAVLLFIYTDGNAEEVLLPADWAGEMAARMMELIR